MPTSKRTAEPESEPAALFEVLTRRPDGHETLLRTTAVSEDAAVDALAERAGMDCEEVVHVRRAST